MKNIERLWNKSNLKQKKDFLEYLDVKNTDIYLDKKWNDIPKSITEKCCNFCGVVGLHICPRQF